MTTPVTPGIRRHFVIVDPTPPAGGAPTPLAGATRGGRPQVHASTLLVTSTGERLVAWFAGTHEGAADVRIQLARADADGGWSDSVTPVDVPGPHWNPVLAQDDHGVNWLFVKSGPSIQTWRTYVARSRDGGRSWERAVELVPGDRSGGRGPVRQAPVRWRGMWVAGGSTEDWLTPRWDCFVDLHTSDGATWNRFAVPVDHAGMQGAGVIQPCLWRRASGGLTMLCRSTEGTAFRSSTDDPRHWPALQPVALPNNNSGLAAVALPDGRIVCAHNPVGDPWGARCPLVLSLSADDGRSWQQAAVIEDGRPFPGSPQQNLSAPPDADRSAAPDDGRPRAATGTGVVTTGRGEYSYPCLALDGDVLLLSYTWQRRGIVLATAPLALLG